MKEVWVDISVPRDTGRIEVNRRIILILRDVTKGFLPGREWGQFCVLRRIRGADSKRKADLSQHEAFRRMSCLSQQARLESFSKVVKYRETTTRCRHEIIKEYRLGPQVDDGKRPPTADSRVKIQNGGTPATSPAR